MDISGILEELTICEPTVSEDFAVYPIVSPFSVSLMSLKEAETLKSAWIQERTVESVSTLDAINNNSIGVLIPFLTQVKGGKQDRTVFEPIMIPAHRPVENPLPIPARCLERGRWAYGDHLSRQTSRIFESSPTRVAGQMAHAFMENQGQTAIWNQVSIAYSVPQTARYHSKSESYVSMNRRMYENDRNLRHLEYSLADGLNIDGQVGIYVTFRGRILGVDIYGASNLWKSYAKESLRGFLFDGFFLRSSISDEQGDARMQLIDELYNFEYQKQEATGDGTLYRISNDDWQGLCLMEDDVPAHFYAVKKQR